MTSILYHAGCRDGFGAAWAAHQALGDTAQYIPAAYQKDPPADLSGQDVFVFDVSFNRAATEKLIASAKSFELHDHHATAFENIGDLAQTYFDMSHSGAILAWQRFFPEREAPLLLKYVEDYDLWKHQLPHSKEIIALIDSLPMDFETWAALANKLETEAGFKEAVSEGSAILRYSEQLAQRIAEKSQTQNFAGHQVPSVNSPILTDQVTRLIMGDAPFAVVWHKQDDGLFKYSLRSAGTFDVGELAKSLGGGGHKFSSSVVLDRLLF